LVGDRVHLHPFCEVVARTYELPAAVSGNGPKISIATSSIGALTDTVQSLAFGLYQPCSQNRDLKCNKIYKLPASSSCLGTFYDPYSSFLITNF